jgi:hypothetical protein
MIAKVVLLCLALSVLAKSNEVHYHYHMDEDRTKSAAHKGYKSCAFIAYTKHSGCMTLGLFSATKRQACRVALAERLAECRAKNPERFLAKGSDRALNSKNAHKGYKLCAAGSYTKLGWCLTKNALNSEGKIKCRAEHQSRLTQCRVNNEGRRLAHKGYKTCALGSWTRHAGCMTKNLFNKEGRAQCRAENSARIAACRAQNPERQLSAHKGYRVCAAGAYAKHSWCMTKNLLNNAGKAECRNVLAARLAECKLNHPGRRLSSDSVCKTEASLEFNECNAEAELATTDSEVASEKQKCQTTFELAKSECNSKRALEKVQKHAMGKEQHLLFCKSRAKHAWFWCDLWAKLRGGEHKDEKIKECANKYDAAVNTCAAQEKPTDNSNTATSSLL